MLHVSGSASVVSSLPSDFVWGVQSILEACMADMEAAKERDPACDKYTQCILYFKGFQAIQCQRIAHWLWIKDRKVCTAYDFGGDG